jgi:hypothetical protein
MEQNSDSSVLTLFQTEGQATTEANENSQYTSLPWPTMENVQLFLICNYRNRCDSLDESDWAAPSSMFKNWGICSSPFLKLVWGSGSQHRVEGPGAQSSTYVWATDSFIVYKTIHVYQWIRSKTTGGWIPVTIDSAKHYTVFLCIYIYYKA